MTATVTSALGATTQTVRAWKITPIGVGFQPLTLGAQAAPHGRQRHGPVVSDGIELRRSKNYYPGNNTPTRHVFGVKHDDFVLKGRWEDARLGGTGAANTIVSTVKKMLAAGVTVRIEWGDLVVATGLLVKFVPERESGAHIAWTLTIEIDSDDSQTPKAPPFTASSPSDSINRILSVPVGFPSASIPKDIPLSFGLLDEIDQYVSIATTLTGEIAGIASDIDSFETASAQELNRLVGSVGQLKTAVLTISNALDDATNDFAIGSAPANSQTSFAQSRAEAKANALLMLAILADLQDQTQQAIAGSTNTTARANDGDSWEGLSLRHYGTADRADDIRQANRITGGTKPIAGRKIHLPK